MPEYLAVGVGWVAVMVWLVTPTPGVAEKRAGLVGEGVDIYHTFTTHLANHPLEQALQHHHERALLPQMFAGSRPDGKLQNFDGGNI